jgi:predicted subunit of tRNA(5-methylaminomethyl-2-thiouridylate) methyltransferase
MKVALLYSGGKDSSLAAYFLDKIGFDVTLVTGTFGINNDYVYAKESARALGFSFEELKLEKESLIEAETIVKRDGFPKNAFNHIHKKALWTAAQKYRILSDGTRRDDRTPFLKSTDIQALEDGSEVEYLPVLHGFGYKTINRLCSELFIIEEGESSKINKGDYEGELRTYLKRKGLNNKEIFPPHQQTRVISWRRSNDKSIEGKKD